MEYKVFEHRIIIDGKSIKSYGIYVLKNNNCISKIYDVSLNRAKVEELVFDLNFYEIELIHLKDIIEDFLVDNF